MSIEKPNLIVLNVSFLNKTTGAVIDLVGNEAYLFLPEVSDKCSVFEKCQCLRWLQLNHKINTSEVKLLSNVEDVEACLAGHYCDRYIYLIYV